MSKRLNAKAATFVPKFGKKKLSTKAKSWQPPSAKRISPTPEEVERKRQEAERRREEERIRLEEERKRQEEEERKRQEEEKREEERKRQEEEARIAEEAKRQEEEEAKRREEEEAKRREEEEAKRREEERQRQEEEERKQQEEEEERRRLEAAASTQSRKYSKEFLLSLKEDFTDLPSGLDVSKHNGMGKRETRDQDHYFSRDNFGTRDSGRQSGRGGDDKWRNNRAPRTDRVDNNRGGRYNNKPQNNRRDHRGRRGGHGRRDQASAPMDIEIKDLEVTENRYIRAKEEDLEADDVLKRKINGILNKLTPEKFSSLMEQFYKLEVDNVVKLDYVVSCVFEKALVMPSYTPMYANFCKILSENPKYKFTDGEAQQSFKRKLLNRCQEEFEKGSGEDEKLLAAFETEEDKTEYLIRVKQRRWGNIRFIGELYCRGLINPKIVYVCFGYLLPNPAEPDEEAVEALCKLFHTIGAQLWKRESDKKSKKGLKTLQTLNSLVAENKITQSRIRFLIQDTVDLAKRNWVARIKKAQAKTIAEIHAEEAEKEKKNKATSNNKGRRHRYEEPTKPTVSRVYHSNRPRKPKQKDADGWESTPQKTARAPRRGQALQSKPERRFSARGGRGGRGGGRGRGQTQKPVKAPVRNIYDLLGGDESSDSAPSSPATPASQTPMPASQPPPMELEPPAEEVEEAPLTANERKVKTRKIRAFLAEYFSVRDVAEVKTCISELKTTQLHGMIIFEGFGAAFEKKASEQELLGDLFESLITDGVLLQKHVRQGYNEMMEWGNDFAPDYPFMFQILGAWTARLILHTPQTMDLAYLASDPPQQLNARNQNNLPKFVAATLQELTKRTDADTVKNMVRATEGFDAAALGLTPELLAEKELSFLG